ncbi:MAG: hypothetical protein IJ949_05525, partial [Oscillospiraceae bacterium]|nr:hypothetical protein [Oscillospiraceae bacterium]
MKRFLSLILATVMLISFVPVYAAPATGGSEIKVVYDFTSFEGAANGAVTNTLVTSYENSYEFWKYSSSGNNRNVPLKLVKDQKTGQNVLCVYCGPANTIDNDESETTSKKIADFYFAYEIYVPKTGKYDIT